MSVKKNFSFILLILIIISFSLLGSFMPPIEGMEEQPDMPVPHCKTENCNNDNYILKTQIVPPVCPMCPSISSGDGKNNSIEGNNSVEGTKSVEKVIEKEVEQNEQNNYTLKKNINIDYGNDKGPLGGLFNRNSTVQKTNEPSQETSQDIQPNNQQGLFKNIPLNNTDLSQEKEQIDELKRQIEELKKNNGECPPCPACERCPEPSFECKKVPNYRSSALGQYLPIPVLNDFSSF